METAVSEVFGMPAAIKPKRRLLRAGLCCVAAAVLCASRGLWAAETAPSKKETGAPDRIDMGLLDPVESPKGGPPEYADLLARYGALINRFFPKMEAFVPKRQFVNDRTRQLLWFDGPLWVTFDCRTGAVSVVTEYQTFGELNSSGGFGGKREEVGGVERDRIAPQLRESLKDKLGLVLPESSSLAELFRRTNKEGRIALSAKWLMQYHGHPHNDDWIMASFELRDGKPCVYHIVNFGSKVSPKDQPIAVTPEKAGKIAVQTITSFVDLVRKLQPKNEPAVPPLDVVVDPAAGPRVAYVYRNDVFTRANPVEVPEDVFYRYESHLCHLVKVKATPRSVPGETLDHLHVFEVHVDCSDGTVVGGVR